MIAKKVPNNPQGKKSEVCLMYGLTLAEFSNASVDFLQNEGYKSDGHECETLHEWLTYNNIGDIDNTPYHKGDDIND